MGLGLAFRGSLDEVHRLAPPDETGGVVASYFVAVYFSAATAPAHSQAGPPCP